MTDEERQQAMLADVKQRASDVLAAADVPVAHAKHPNARRMLLNELSAACKAELGGDLEQGQWPEFVAMRERVAELEQINREQAQACLELSQLSARLKNALTQAKAREQRARPVAP